MGEFHNCAFNEFSFSNFPLSVTRLVVCVCNENCRHWTESGSLFSLSPIRATGDSGQGIPAVLIVRDL